MNMMTPGELVAVETAQLFDNPDEMLKRAPALFAQSAHPKMSERYAFTNTYDIIRHIHHRGWHVTSVLGGNHRYNRMIIRMRHNDTSMRSDGEVPELVIVDSHDGSSRWKMLLGVLRLICLNGMVAMDSIYSRSYLHLTEDLHARIMLDIEDIQPHIVALQKSVERFKQYKTAEAERIALADAVVKMRFGEERSGSFVADMRNLFLQRRRGDDDANDMYTVMNVIQENALRGGMHYIVNNTVRRAAPINNAGRNLGINRTVWQRATELMDRRAA